MIGASGQEMTRAEAEREHYEDILAWAGEHAPELLPEDPSDPDEWHGVKDAIEAAMFAAAYQARPVQPAPAGGYEPEPF